MHVAETYATEINDQLHLPLLSREPGPTEEGGSRLSLMQALFRNPRQACWIIAEGEGFPERDIQAGDLLAIDKQRPPRNGDLVLVCIDQQRICARLNLPKHCLEFANGEQQRMQDVAQLVVEGVVCASIRQF